MSKYFVAPENIKNLDQYLCGLVTGILSVKNLHAFHAYAMKKGLLTDEQSEYAASMAFELQKLLKLYQSQITLVEELTKLDRKKVLKEYYKVLGITPEKTQGKANETKEPRDAKDDPLDAKKPRATKKRNSKSPRKPRKGVLPSAVDKKNSPKNERA